MGAQSALAGDVRTEERSGTQQTLGNDRVRSERNAVAENRGNEIDPDQREQKRSINENGLLRSIADLVAGSEVPDTQTSRQDGSCT